jgi:5,10-methylene-tetrahydrofolate dehydrogenase/methenyl tetrahydrofolate cyclohydrolase
MQKILNVYYDYPNSASDTYLKYLTKDCEANDIKVNIIDNIEDWIKKPRGTTLILQPTIKDLEIEKIMLNNVDEPSATAQGIFDYITKLYPHRNKIIGVIGRGNVGKTLINKLIDYGYSVIEMNSQTSSFDREWLSSHCNVLVGLSSTDHIITANECDSLHNIHEVLLIDAGDNFDTKDKLRCGKWTREEIINRINNYYREYKAGDYYV